MEDKKREELASKLVKFIGWVALVVLAAFTARLTCDDEYSFKFMVVLCLYLITWSVTVERRKL